METKFNFNSQVCTSREQSEALLQLGLKKETADMYMTPSWGGSKIIGYYAPDVVTFDDHFDENLNDLPAWSLHRLIEMMPENIFTGVRNQWHRVMYNSVLSYEEGDDSLVSFRGGSIYDRFISCIYWLIKEGYFNKEYLCEN